MCPVTDRRHLSLTPSQTVIILCMIVIHVSCYRQVPFVHRHPLKLLPFYACLMYICYTGVLLLTGEGYICEEMKSTSLYGFVQFAVFAQIGTAMNIAYTRHTALPAFIQWQTEYDQKMRETFQMIPPVVSDSADVASTTSSSSFSWPLTTETMQKFAGITHLHTYIHIHTRTLPLTLKTHPLMTMFLMTHLLSHPLLTFPFPSCLMTHPLPHAGIVVLVFIIDGIISLVYSRTTCGSYSPLWRFGLLSFVAPLGYVLLNKWFWMAVDRLTKTPDVIAYEEGDRR